MENEIEKKYSLIGVNSNAYSVIAYVTKCMRKEGCSEKDINEYLKDASSSDYKHLMCISIDVLNLLNSKYEL